MTCGHKKGKPSLQQDGSENLSVVVLLFQALGPSRQLQTQHMAGKTYDVDTGAQSKAGEGVIVGANIPMGNWPSLQGGHQCCQSGVACW